MPVPHHFPAGIHKVGIGIDDVGVFHGRVGISLKNRGIGERVAGIQENHIFPSRSLKPFVHGVVQATVRLTHQPEALHAFPARHGNGVVGRRTVDDYMLEATESLLFDRPEGRGQLTSGIERYCDDRHKRQF